MRRYCLLLLILTAVASIATAQTITGTILGTVTDPSGSAVPNAKVRITNSDTNITTNISTNHEGEYVAPLLPPGRYEVAVEASGFKSFRQINIALTLDEKVRVNVAMTIGQVGEMVEISSNTAQALQTDSSDLNTSISQQIIQNIPNIGRNPMAYAVIVPGIVPRQGFEAVDNTAIGDDSRKQFSNFTVNGSRPISSEILLDGAPNTSGAFNEISVLPNPDAIGEMKIITNAYSAEFGRAGGGVVSFGTKSGTNDLHGSLYEFFRNPVLNANTFGNNSFGNNPDGTAIRPKGKFNVNQFGGTIGGPIWLPKPAFRPFGYNGKNQSFFFFAYEGVRRADDASAILTMPTALERRGDFSQSFAQIRNPANGQLFTVPRQIYAPFASTTNIETLAPNQFRLTRQQFQDGGVLNKIPQQFINPTAQRLINLYPLPNMTPLQLDGSQNYFDATSRRTDTDQIIFKLDYNFSEKHRSFFRYTTDWSLSTPANRFRNTDPQATDQAPTRQYNPSATLGHTWTISPTSLAEFRANMTRINLTLLPSSGLNSDLSGLGFAQDMVNVAPSRAFPRIALGGNYQQIGLGNFVLRDNHTTNLAFNGSYTKILTKWTLKVGGEYRSMLNNFYQAFVPSFAFSPNSFTRSCGGTGCPTLPFDRSESFVLADFLIGNLDGQVGSGQFTTGDPRVALKNSYWGFYSQNDWKATRNLTINLGLRWDYQGALTERYNRLSQFDRAARNLTGTAGQYEFSGVGGNARGQTDPDYRNFGPRVGFAYRIMDKTVLRGAYGVSYDQVTGVGSGAQGFGTDGFSSPAFIRPRPLSGLEILERPFNNAFNGGGMVIGANPTDPRFFGASVTAIDRRQRTPYVQQWNLTLERQILGMNLSASYVGTKGTRLIIQQLPVNGDNAINPSVLAGARSELIRTGINPLSAQVPNPFFGIIPSGNPTVSSPTITQLQLARAFPAYGGITAFQQRFGSSSYQALQLSVQRGFANGFEIGGNYTWSKNIDIGNSISVNSGNTANGGGSSTFTVSDFKLERSIANSDIPHRAVIYYVAELPFGRNKPLLSNTPVLSYLVGGWKLAGVTTFQTGLPLGITGGGFGRPDLIGDPVLPKEYRVYGDGVTAHPLPDGTSIVVPNRRLLYFNPRAFRNRTIETPRVGQPGTQIINDVYWYGTTPRFLGSLRGWGVNNWNMTLSRDFSWKDRMKFELRGEAVNVFNRKEFGDGAIARGFGAANLIPANGLLGQTTDANFGTLDITNNTGRTPRYLQLSLKLTF
jgi:trimeric autotransporter adhesin